jgi:hypothetical protein
VEARQFPHHPPFVTSLQGWQWGSGVPDFLESSGMYVNQDSVSDTWILQLESERRVHLILTSEFSKETHNLQFVLKTMGQHHGGKDRSLVVRQEFLNLCSLKTTKLV